MAKAYQLAKRFSEDIDLAIVTDPKLSEHDRDDLIALIEMEIALKPLSENESRRIVSRNKKFRQTHWDYPRQASGANDPAKDKIMLKLTSSATTTPWAHLPIRTLIAEFLLKTNRGDQIKELELDDFEIQVLSHKRTFSEKVKEKIRHLYDLTLLFRGSDIKEFVMSKKFEEMINEAQSSDQTIPGLGEIANKPWKSASIFERPTKTLAQLKSTYESQLGPLVFDRDEMPPIKEIEEMLTSVVGKSLRKKNAKPKVTQLTLIT